MSENRRNSYRCPSTQFSEATVLTRGGKKTISSVVKIFDESAGGFGGRISTPPPFAEGDTVGLEYADKDMLCQVSYVADANEGVSADDQSSYRFGLQIIEEIEDSPEKKNVSRSGKVTYFAHSSAMGPLVAAIIIFVVAVSGWLYFESTKEYTDELGRKYKGSPKTAFDNLYQSVFGKKQKRSVHNTQQK